MHMKKHHSSNGCAKQTTSSQAKNTRLVLASGFQTSVLFKNTTKHDFFLSMNHLAHYTPAEYKAILGYKPNAGKRISSTPSNFKAPDSIDWREKNVVNEIKDQGQCGSCWTFSTIQAQESQWAIKHNKLYSLSEQNLVDCVISCYGCNGGLMEPAYDYVIQYQQGKFMTEEDYPYTAKDGNCKFVLSKGVTQVTLHHN